MRTKRPARTLRQCQQKFPKTKLVFEGQDSYKMAYQLYRNTTLGNTLQESLDELIQVSLRGEQMQCKYDYERRQVTNAWRKFYRCSNSSSSTVAMGTAFPGCQAKGTRSLIQSWLATILTSLSTKVILDSLKNLRF